LQGVFPQVEPPFKEANPDPTETPTPFEPFPLTETVRPPTHTTVGPTSTITPTPTPADPWGDFPGPTRSSAIEIPPPVPKLNLPPEAVNIVILGSDEAPHRYGHRTDTILILSLDKKTGKATMLSVPRDLYVYIPGWSMERINVASVFGGPEMVQQTILYNFGIEIDHWVRVNFKGFMTAVDLLGGIDVQVGRAMSDSCGGKIYSYAPGKYHMDGFTALCYVRMRKTTSDFDRLRRQQEVFLAIFRRILTLDGLTRVPQLYSKFSSLVQSNMELDAVLPLIPLAADLASGSADLKSFSIDSSMTTAWRVPITGAAVLLPKREEILNMLHIAFESQ
jgi:LCP family protein required for cell wall assembly